MGYLDKALEAIQQQGIPVSYFHLVETTLHEIGRQYQPGLIKRIKEDTGKWKELLQLEDRINHAGDVVTLKNALSDYREFFLEMAEAYGKGGQA